MRPVNSSGGNGPRGFYGFMKSGKKTDKTPLQGTAGNFQRRGAIRRKGGARSMLAGRLDASGGKGAEKASVKVSRVVRSGEGPRRGFGTPWFGRLREGIASVFSHIVSTCGRVLSRNRGSANITESKVKKLGKKHGLYKKNEGGAYTPDMHYGTPFNIPRPEVVNLEAPSTSGTRKSPRLQEKAQKASSEDSKAEATQKSSKVEDPAQSGQRKGILKKSGGSSKNKGSVRWEDQQ
ncbi:hypothetical protein [Chlamydia vaughanii]|uniref:hypothetical protein n=1 Tax=Chlamydia vaughanii TaxID=3112552 RepID=UPI0032B2E7CF